MIAQLSTLGKVNGVSLSQSLKRYKKIEIVPNVVIRPTSINTKTTTAKIHIWPTSSAVPASNFMAKTECGHYRIIGRTQLPLTSLAIAVHKNRLHRQNELVLLHKDEWFYFHYRRELKEVAADEIWNGAMGEIDVLPIYISTIDRGVFPKVRGLI